MDHTHTTLLTEPYNTGAVVNLGWRAWDSMDDSAAMAAGGGRKEDPAAMVEEEGWEDGPAAMAVEGGHEDVAGVGSTVTSSRLVLHSSDHAIDVHRAPPLSYEKNMVAGSHGEQPIQNNESLPMRVNVVGAIGANTQANDSTIGCAVREARANGTPVQVVDNAGPALIVPEVGMSFDSEKKAYDM
ncbi:hypothetical protein BS78_09G190300 [Paspalum vaginatum]|nr:hypothetical protein BS78_09G190300 [Paspalum vaginatum]